MYISSIMYKLLIFIVLISIKINFAFAEIIDEIKILGNKRVSKETIINFSEIKKGDDVTNNILNNSLKELIEKKLKKHKTKFIPVDSEHFLYLQYFQFDQEFFQYFYNYIFHLLSF